MGTPSYLIKIDKRLELKRGFVSSLNYYLKDYCRGHEARISQP